MSGMFAVLRPRTMAARRMIGTDTNMIRKAAARPIVIGNPRAMRLATDSCLAGGGALAATARPTATGTISASPVHTSRTIQDGTQCGSGTNASIKAAIFGMTIPTSRIGHATAPPTMIDRNVCSLAVV